MTGTGPTNPVGPAPVSLAHLRLRFTKLGKVRFASHRDVARLWERAVRRAGLPVAYSGGFSPHPLLSFGLALPTGCESTAEYLDVALEPGGPLGSPPDTEVGDPAVCADLSAQAAGLLDPHLPEGVTVTAATWVPAGAPSLQQQVTSCTWQVAVTTAPGRAEAAVAATLAATSLPVRRERKGQTTIEDVRPALLGLHLEERSVGHGPVLVVETATRPRGVRPSELAEALGIPLGIARRVHQWIDCDGSRSEPIVTGPARCLAAQGSPP